MGAGRTELMKMIYGALPKTQGSVALEGKICRGSKSLQMHLPQGIVYISEDRKRDGFSARYVSKENMSLTALPYFSRTMGDLKS